MASRHERHCPVCDKRVLNYGSNGCEDDAGQSWCVVHVEQTNPQASLNIRLVDGRAVTIDTIYVGQSHAGWYGGAPQKIWDDCSHRINPLHGQSWPAYVVPPVSRRSDTPLLPRWKIQAMLTSTSLSPTTAVPVDGSRLMLVFFCNDIASRSITALIRDQVANLDEETWRAHAADVVL